MTILVCILKTNYCFQVQAEEEILEKNLINCEKENKRLQEKCGLYKSDLEILKEKLRYSILLQKKDFCGEMKKLKHFGIEYFVYFNCGLKLCRKVGFMTNCFLGIMK